MRAMPDESHTLWMIIGGECRVCHMQTVSLAHNDAPLDGLECPRCASMAVEAVAITRDH